MNTDEFDFSGLSAREKEQCVLYEYARESPYVEWLFSQITGNRRGCHLDGRKLLSTPDGDVDFLVVWMETNWHLRLPFSYKDLNFRSLRDLRGDEAIAKRSEFGPHIFPDDRATPVSEYQPSSSEDRASCDTKLLAVPLRGGMSAAVKAVREFYKKYSVAERRPFIPTIRNFKDWLRRMTAFRLRREFKQMGSVVDETEQCKRLGIDPPYAHASGWTTACRSTEERLGLNVTWHSAESTFPPPPPAPPVRPKAKRRYLGQGKSGLTT